jgi:inner membrane protein
VAEEGIRQRAAVHGPRRGRERSRRLVVAAGAVVAIGALDLVGEAASWPVVVRGLLDEPAHLLTAYVLLLAMGRPLVPGGRDAWALTGAVLIDVDHLPQFLGFPGWAVAGGRPPTHSLALVLVLLGAGLAGRRVAAARYLAIGVLLHFVRDLATGPGVPLLWPLRGSVLLPYAGYAALMCLAAVACALVAPRLTPAAPPSAPSSPPMPR